VIVEMIPIVSGELYLPLLRGDEENVGGHQKKRREVLGNCWSKKKYNCPSIRQFYRDR
jgi:hypothetical protein